VDPAACAAGFEEARRQVEVSQLVLEHDLQQEIRERLLDVEHDLQQRIRKTLLDAAGDGP